MYTLTARMEQHLKSDLERYHALFDGGRCQGWEQEELIVRAIQSDTSAQHHPFWREAGHDDKADILVRVNGKRYPLQVKSGKIQSARLVLSGHRLGRFDGDLAEISDYLNKASANIISLSYLQTDDDTGRHHEYTLRYVSVDYLRGLAGKGWEKHGAQYRQTNEHGVEFSLRPSMSWQIWWYIPLSLLGDGKVMSIK